MPKRQITFYVEEDEWAYINHYAQCHKKEVKNVAADALTQYVKKHPLNEAQADRFLGLGYQIPLCFLRDGPVGALRPKGSLYSSITSLTQEAKKERAPRVLMTDNEFERLVKGWGEKTARAAIDKLSAYKQSTGKTYKSDYHAILNWALGAVKGQKTGEIPAPTRSEKPAPLSCPDCGKSLVESVGGLMVCTCGGVWEKSGDGLRKYEREVV